MDKPIIVNPDHCKPLSASERGGKCRSCEKPQAKWLFGDDDPHPVCSLCFLYKTFWGQNRKLEIDQMVVEVEKQVGRTFLRDSDGNMISESDATRVAGSIILTSHMIRSALHSHIRRETVRSLVEDGGEEPDASEGPSEAPESPEDGVDDA